MPHTKMIQHNDFHRYLMAIEECRFLNKINKKTKIKKILNEISWPDLKCPRNCIGFLKHEPRNNRFRCMTCTGSKYTITTTDAFDYCMFKKGVLVCDEQSLQECKMHAIISESSLVKSGYIAPKYCDSNCCVGKNNECFLTMKSPKNNYHRRDGKCGRLRKILSKVFLS